MTRRPLFQKAAYAGTAAVSPAEIAEEQLHWLDRVCQGQEAWTVDTVGVDNGRRRRKDIVPEHSKLRLAVFILHAHNAPQMGCRGAARG